MFRGRRPRRFSTSRNWRGERLRCSNGMVSSSSISLLRPRTTTNERRRRAASAALRDLSMAGALCSGGDDPGGFRPREIGVGKGCAALMEWFRRRPFHSSGHGRRQTRGVGARLLPRSATSPWREHYVQGETTQEVFDLAKLAWGKVALL